MKQSEKLTQLLELMQANPELPVIPCVDGDVVGGDEYCCWLGSWGESAVQEFIIGKERTYYREDDICEMNDVLYERYDPELVDSMTAADLPHCDGETADGNGQWHDAESDPPRFEKDQYWLGPFLVTDGFCKPFEAYYHIENFRSVKTKLWERPTMRGEGIWPIRPERIKYWMEWPTPPKEEQHETD